MPQSMAMPKVVVNSTMTTDTLISLRDLASALAATETHAGVPSHQIDMPFALTAVLCHFLVTAKICLLTKHEPND